MIRVLLLTIITFVLLVSDACAGDVEFAIDGTKNRLYLTYRGEIKKGDAERLRQKIMQERYNFLRATALTINSQGGDLEEALKIAELIENAGLRLGVEKGGLCASSCFLIYVSAPIRFSQSPIIIHRPFYRMGSVSGADASSYERAYRAAFSLTRAYLSERLVPDYLIENLMNKSSSEGYMFSDKDIEAVGISSPALLEYQLQVCHMPGDRPITNEEIYSLNECLNKYLFQAKLKLLFGNNYISAGDSFRQFDEYHKHVSESDPDYHKKSKYFIPAIKKIIDTQHPQMWLDLAKKAYASQP